jgi:hypothetical protein
MLSILGIVLVALGTWIIVGNYIVAIGWMLAKRRGSYLPLLGGIFAAVGGLLLPAGWTLGLWWVPLILDLGCLPLIAGIIVDMAKKRISRSDNG